MQSHSPGPQAWFYGAYGFMSKGDIFQRGKRVASERQQAILDPWKPELSFRPDAIACANARALCMEGRTSAQIRQLIADHQALLDNYIALYSATDFRYVLPPKLNLRMPPIHEIVVAQQLLHALIRTDSNPAMALQRADLDLAHWRRVLAETNTLISKMAASQAVSRALELRVALLDRLDAKSRALAARVSPLSSEEVSINDALRFEVAIDYVVMTNLDSVLSGLPGERPGVHEILPFRPNRTFNRHLQDYEQTFAMAQMSRDGLIASMTSPLPKLHAVTWWDYVINGRGVWLLQQADATEKYGAYMLALRDLELQFSRLSGQ